MRDFWAHTASILTFSHQYGRYKVNEELRKKLTKKEKKKNVFFKNVVYTLVITGYVCYLLCGPPP